MVNLFHDSEQRDGVTFNWNLFPSTRLEASQLSTPLGCLYQPLLESQVSSTQFPIQCTTCKNYMNPFIKVDRANNMWWCQMCQKRTFLPPDFKIPDQAESDSEWPPQLRSKSTTIEYELPENINEKVQENLPFTFVFIIDVFAHLDDVQDEVFQTLIDSLIHSIEQIPNGYLIGLVTFEETVHIHDLVGSTSYSFNKNFVQGHKAKSAYKSIFDKPTIDKVLERIGLTRSTLQNDYQESQLVQKNILVELNDETRSQISSYIKNLKPKVITSYKPDASPGLAHYITSLLLSQCTFKYFMGKVIYASSVAGTNFPGTIVNPELKEVIRSHNDISKLNAPNFLPSSKFYQALAYIASGQTFENAWYIADSTSVKTTDYELSSTNPTWSVDLCSSSLDQTGIYEMKSLSSYTMGKIYLFESFNSNQFKQSLYNAINLSDQTFRNTLTITTSNNLKISRMIFTGGYALPSSYHKSGEKFYNSYHEKISDTLTKFDSALQKKNFTNRWKFNELSGGDTLAIYFEMNTVKSSKEITSNGTKEVFVQFQVNYYDIVRKKWFLKVTTVQRPTTLAIILKRSDILKEREVLLSFNQKCWSVLLARLLINKINTTLGYDKFDNLIDLMDSVIIKLLHNFGGLSLKANSSLEEQSNPYYMLQQIYEINENFKDLPSLIYNLRKNPQLIRIFNSSPDETAYYHSWFMRMDEKLSINAIQPKLFKVDDKSEEIALNSKCLNLPSKTFLIMDTIFHIIVYYITNGNESKLDLHHSKNDYLLDTRDKSILPALEFIDKDLHENPRPFIPKYVITQTNHSQARFLIARLDPIEKDLPTVNAIPKKVDKGFLSYFKSKIDISTSYDLIMTDDPSLKQYYDGLVKSIKVYKVEQDSN
ncbi:ScSEC23 cytoplasmic GTPase-activating protein-like protein [Scheffersomyces coipomensis]|uniref:ScSEC23 cytoplasmic GTPase-activating protein-like protein n=1 Tax=Scheffersomyces coipomensis TaxID=1788519 RepID=UPI00315DC6E8